MGEYAEISWKRELARGFRSSVEPRTGRNPIAASCDICGKGLREIGGEMFESARQHYKHKHKGEEMPRKYHVGVWVSHNA